MNVEITWPHGRGDELGTVQCVTAGRHDELGIVQCFSLLPLRVLYDTVGQILRRSNFLDYNPEQPVLSFILFNLETLNTLARWESYTIRAWAQNCHRLLPRPTLIVPSSFSCVIGEDQRATQE